MWPAARVQNADAWHRVAQPGVQAAGAPSSSCIRPGGPQSLGLGVGAIDSANGIAVRRWVVAASVKLELIASVSQLPISGAPPNLPCPGGGGTSAGMIHVGISMYALSNV